MRFALIIQVHYGTKATAFDSVFVNFYTFESHMQFVYKQVHQRSAAVNSAVCAAYSRQMSYISVSKILELVRVLVQLYFYLWLMGLL